MTVYVSSSVSRARQKTGGATRNHFSRFSHQFLYDLSQKRRNLQQRQLRWAANIYHYYIIMPVDIDTLSKSLEGRFI